MSAEDKIADQEKEIVQLRKEIFRLTEENLSLREAGRSLRAELSDGTSKASFSDMMYRSGDVSSAIREWDEAERPYLEAP